MNGGDETWQKWPFLFFIPGPGLPDFLGTTYQNGEKIYQRTKNVPNGHTFI
jgi:hypothetical protein